MSALNRIIRKSSRKVHNALTPGEAKHEELKIKSEEIGDELMQVSDNFAKVGFKILVVIAIPLTLVYSCAVYLR